MSLGQHSKAESCYRDLIDRNQENYAYIEGLEKAMKLATTEERLALYQQLIREYPKSHVIKRMPLLVSTGKCVELLAYVGCVSDL